MSLTTFAYYLKTQNPIFSEMPSRKRLLFCSLIALIVVVIMTAVMCLNDFGQGPDDDLGIAIVLSTRYANAGQTPFTNALLNQFVFFLNVNYPIFNWALITERLSAMLSLFVLVFTVLRYTPKGFAFTLIGLVCAVVYPSCTFSANFTVVAALCVFTGEAAICFGTLKNSNLLGLLGILLMVLGFMWRWNILLLSFPFFISAIAVMLLWNRNKEKSLISSMIKKVLWMISLLAILLVSLSCYHSMIWDKPEWNSWNTYNNARSILSDYPVKPYDDIAKQLEEIGVSENDYWCMTHWITADPTYFTAERLQAVAEIASNFNSGDILGCLKSEIGSLFISNYALGLMVICTIAVAVLATNKKTLLVAAISVFIGFCASIYFRYTGRFPLRVEMPLWLFSLLPIIPIIACSSLNRNCNQIIEENRFRSHNSIFGFGTISTVFGVVIGVSCVIGSLMQFLPTFNISDINQFKQSTNETNENYLIKHFSQTEDVFVWDVWAYTIVEKELKFRYLPPENFMNHNLLTGGWTQGSSFINSNKILKEAENPLKSLSNSINTYFVSEKHEVIDHVLLFLQEHYRKDLRFKVIETVNIKNGHQLYVVKFKTK